MKIQMSVLKPLLIISVGTLGMFVGLTTASGPMRAQTVLTPIPSEVAGPAADSVWWKHAVIYEIYPRSFADSNADGIGDLNGITSHLDYLEKLGVDAMWIAPMYPSPQVDFGYDISDYEAVDPQYGTLADFDRLLAEAGRHHIRVVLDMVLNHTSDQSRWFQESSASRDNPKADWYVWNAGVAANAPGVTAYQKRYEHEGVVPPNNWVSLFGGSAWEWVPARRQFYYHKFYKQQPDLNWRNPAVEKSMFDAMRFWLDRGVAGFRLDAIPTLFEDEKLRDEPELGGINAQGDPKLDSIYTNNLPAVHEVIRRMRTMASRYPGDRVLIGETYLPDTKELDKWYGGAAHDELQLPMDMLVGFGKSNFGNSNLDATMFEHHLAEVETQVHGSQPLLVFDNHDNIRSIDRFGDDRHDASIARIVATILLTTKGTALTYYGAEIGMRTSTPQRKSDVKDPIGITGWPKEKGRDGERTPMQWSSAPQAGFSGDPQTWLPVAPDYKTVNVAAEQADPESLLNWYGKLIALRRTNEAMHTGGMAMLSGDKDGILSFVRTAASPDKTSVLVAVNMGASSQTVSFDLGPLKMNSSLVKTVAESGYAPDAVHSLKSAVLAPFSVWIAEVR